MTEARAGRFDQFGSFLRTQRQLAQLSLRQLAKLTNVSNPYLSQLERGLHQPSVHVLKSLSEALDISLDVLLAHAADLPGEAASPDRPSTEAAIRSDPRLSESQKAALLSVYRTMVAEEDTAPATPARRAAGSTRKQG